MTTNEVQTHTLPNGMLVLTKEVHTAPVATCWIWYRVGARNEPGGLTGISHWVEHMLFKGTPTVPRGAFDRIIARNGGSFNGFTWIDFTAYFETLPADRMNDAGFAGVDSAPANLDDRAVGLLRTRMHDPPTTHGVCRYWIRTVSKL